MKRSHLTAGRRPAVCELHGDWTELVMRCDLRERRLPAFDERGTCLFHGRSAEE